MTIPHRYKRRCDEFQKEQLKLERALEIKVGSWEGPAGRPPCCFVSLVFAADPPVPSPPSHGSLAHFLPESSSALLFLCCLPMQDSQIEAFMVVAQRQIAFLEEKLKEAQKIP